MKPMHNAILIAITMLVLTPATLPAMPACPPQLTVHLAGHESWVVTGPAVEPIVLEVEPETPLAFSWFAEHWLGGAPDGYRYGWDVTDPADPQDPGWATAGFVADLTAAEPRAFSSGVHTLRIAAVDDAGRVTSAWFVLDLGAPTADETLTWGELQALYRGAGR